MHISLIVAMTAERVIGVGGRLPWHLPEDLKRFRLLTTGHCVVMGRKTFESIGKALPKRRNMVVSRGGGAAVEGVEWFTTIEAAIEAARAAGETELFVIGGGQIYAAAMAAADRMYVTLVRPASPVQGDTYFPAWDESAWRAVRREGGGECEYVLYERNVGG